MTLLIQRYLHTQGVSEMNVKREILMQGVELAPIVERLKEEGTKRGLSQSANNEYGPVFINHHYDLRIERDPGDWGQYRLMLMHKLQPKSSFFGMFRRG